MRHYRFALGRLLLAKRDIDLVRKFGPKAKRLAELQSASSTNWRARRAGFPGDLLPDPDPVESKALRENVLKSLPKVKAVALRLGEREDGAHMLPASDLDALLSHEESPLAHQAKVDDALDQLLSLGSDELASARCAVLNPLVWIRDAAALVLGLPRYVLSLAGFDSDDARVKVLEVVLKIVWLVSLVGTLIWLGLSRTEIAGILARTFGGG